MRQSKELFCDECGTGFFVSIEEAKFLKNISPSIEGRVMHLSLPVKCAGCREQQRLSFRNEWNLFHRKCDFTAESLISIYPKDSPYKICKQEHWWSDEYDPLDYGRDFDFSRPFFEQFHELNLAVPKPAIQNAKSENSAYTNYSWQNKNCYMCVGSGGNEDCYNCYRVMHSKDVFDCYDLQKSELCFECVQSSNLYRCVHSRNCHNSDELFLCENCRGCSNCFACTNLRNEKFFIFNQSVSEQEYHSIIAELKKDFPRTLQKYNELKTEDAPPARYLVNCEDCVGDQLLNCSRCTSVFTLKESQDCRFLGNGENDKDCVDCNFTDNSELQYFSTNLEKNYKVLFSALVWYTSESMYLNTCFNSSNLFGCSAMKRNSFCILNKQYAKSKYYKMLAKIINHMKETKEWSRFFPIAISPFPYNTSLAADYYPLSKAAAIEKGYTWHDAKPENPKKDSLLKSTKSEERICSVSGKAFKIIPQEMRLCDELRLEFPIKCPEVRRDERMGNVKRTISEYLK